MADAFESNSSGLDSPAKDAFAITGNDSTDLTTSTRGIYIGGAGNLKVDMVSGNTVTFTGVLAGVVYPIRARRVYATGTTATGIIGLW